MRFIILFFTSLIIVSGSCTGNRKKLSVADRDSIYSAAHIQDLSIVHPREALALLDTAEAEKLMTPFDISRLRCLAYHNGLASYRLALVHGLKAYNMPDACNDLGLFLNLVELIADEYHNNGDYTESVRYCTEGLEISGHIGDKASEANFHVTFGLNLLEMRRLDEAFRHFHLAVDILEKEAEGSLSYVSWDDYIYALGMTINSYCYEKQYDEAISMLPAYRRAIKGLEKCEDIIDGLADMRRASGYAAYAYIYIVRKGMWQKRTGCMLYLRKPEWLQCRMVKTLESHICFLLDAIVRLCVMSNVRRITGARMLTLLVTIMSNTI